MTLAWSECGGDVVQRLLEGLTRVGAKQWASRFLEQEPGERQALDTELAVGFQEGDKREQAAAAARDRRGVQARQWVLCGVLGCLQDDDE